MEWALAIIAILAVLVVLFFIFRDARPASALLLPVHTVTVDVASVPPSLGDTVPSVV